LFEFKDGFEKNNIGRFFQELDFKPNSTLQNWFVRRGLHPFINYWKVSSLVDVGSPTQPPHVETP